MGFEMRGGQVTVWIILGILLVGSVALFFSIDRSSKSTNPESSAVFDMQSYLDECTTRYVNEAVDLILPNGGVLQNKNSVLWNGIEVEYLCYNRGPYNQPPLGTCVPQNMIKNTVKKEIKKYLDDGRMNGCFNEMKKEYDKRGELNYEDSLPPEVSVNFTLDKITIEIKKKTVVKKLGERKRFEDFRVDVKSPAWNLADIANTIAKQEIEACYFDYVGYGILNNRYDITPHTMTGSSASGTIVYTINDTKSGKTMNIAIRACASGLGLTGGTI